MRPNFADKPKSRLQAALLGALVVAALLAAGSYLKRGWRAPQVLRVERPLMGTQWTIELAHSGDSLKAQQAVQKAFAELERIDALMSEWKPDSPLSAINAAAGRALVAVPEELRAIIERGMRYGDKSGGAFDITWHGMRQIWHFGAEPFRVPDAGAVEEARTRVNYRAIRIEGNRVGLMKPGMSIGLGGIAKGYAVDRAAAILRQAGFNDFLVDGGGDILVSGHKGERPWRLGIQDPRGERGTLLGVVTLSGGALVTSGDYERFRIVNGVRYHHIIDPHTGWPARVCQSVSVVAVSAEKADALATAIFVLGPQKGIELARAEGVETFIVDESGKRHWTEGFRKLGDDSLFGGH